MQWLGFKEFKKWNHAVIFKLFSKLYRTDFIRNSGLQLFERIISMSLTFLISIFLIRYLMPAEYGIFAYANSYIIIFSTLTTMGIQPIVVRELVNRDFSQAAVLGSAFIIMLLGSVLALVLIMTTSIFAHNPVIMNWFIFIYALNGIVASSAIINYYFQSEIKTNLTAFAMLLQDGFDFCAKLWLIHIKAELIWFALESLASICVLYALIWLFYWQDKNKVKWQINYAVIKYVLLQSFPLAISGIVVNLYMRLDQIMIEHYLGLTAVAEYSVGVKLIEAVYILPAILAPNLLPILVRKYREAPLECELFFIKILRYFTIIAIVFIILFFVFGSNAVQLLYGAKYQQSGKVLQWVSLCILPIYLSVITGLWLQITKLQKYIMYRHIMGFGVCIILNLVLIPRYGIFGAVIATVVAYFTAAVLSSILLKDIRKIFHFYLKVLWCY